MTKKNEGATERALALAAGAGIVCGNSKAMAVRRPAPYNGGRLAAPRCLESPAKVRVNSAEKREKDGEQPAKPCNRLSRSSERPHKFVAVAICTEQAEAEPVVAGIQEG